MFVEIPARRHIRTVVGEAKIVDAGRNKGDWTGLESEVTEEASESDVGRRTGLGDGCAEESDFAINDSGSVVALFLV